MSSRKPGYTFRLSTITFLGIILLLAACGDVSPSPIISPSPTPAFPTIGVATATASVQGTVTTTVASNCLPPPASGNSPAGNGVSLKLKCATPAQSGHSSRVDSTDFSPDGKLLASLGLDNTIRLWEIATGRELRVIQTSSSSRWVIFSADSKTVIAVAKDHIKSWDVATGREVWTLSLKGIKEVSQVAFSSNVKMIAVAGYDGNVVLGDLTTGQILTTFKAHEDWILSVAFSPDGKTLATGGGTDKPFDVRSQYAIVKLWDVSQPAKGAKELSTLKGFSDNVRTLVFSPAGKTLATLISNDSLKLWDISTGQELSTINSTRDDRLLGIMFSPDGKSFASGQVVKKGQNPETILKLWEVNSGKELKAFPAIQGEFTPGAFSPDGKVIVGWNELRGSYSSLKLWEVATGKELTNIAASLPYFQTRTPFSPNGKLLVTAGAEGGKIQLWEVPDGKEYLNLSKQAASIGGIKFSPDGKTFLGAVGSAIKIWDANSGAELRTLRDHKDQVWTLALSPDGKTLASAGGVDFDNREVIGDIEVRIWDVATGKVLRKIQALSDDKHTLNVDLKSVRSLAFSPDGKILASTGGSNSPGGCADGEIKFWEVSSGKLLNTLQSKIQPKKLYGLHGEDFCVTSVAFSPDGKIIAGGAGSIVRFWDVTTGKELFIIESSSTAHISFSPFSPDGKLIATSGYGMSNTDKGIIQIWEVATQKETGSMETDNFYSGAIGFSPDGKFLVTTSYNQTIKLLDVPNKRELFSTTEQQTFGLQSVALSPDGKRLISSHADGSLKIWDVVTT